MGRRVHTTLQSLAIALALALGFGYVAGARSVFAYSELRCAPGYTAQPVSIAPVYQCRPRIPDPTLHQWPEVVATQHEIALYLAHLRVRVFHIDLVWGTNHGLAFDVTAPPHR